MVKSTNDEDSHENSSRQEVNHTAKHLGLYDAITTDSLFERLTSALSDTQQTAELLHTIFPDTTNRLVFIRCIMGFYCTTLNFLTYLTKKEPGQHSRYSDWLRTGRSRSRSSSPGKVTNFVFSKSSRPALGSTQPPFQWVPEAFSGRKAGHSPPTSAEVKKIWIYTSTPHTPSWRRALPYLRMKYGHQREEVPGD
jgi:hypothetical protein